MFFFVISLKQCLVQMDVQALLLSISGETNRVEATQHFFSPPVCAEGSRGRGELIACGPKRKLFFLSLIQVRGQRVITQ